MEIALVKLSDRIDLHCDRDFRHCYVSLQRTLRAVTKQFALTSTSVSRRDYGPHLGDLTANGKVTGTLCSPTACAVYIPTFPEQ